MYFFHKNKLKIMLISATVILAVFIITGISFEHNGLLGKEVLGAASKPVQTAVTKGSNSVSGFFGYLTSMKGYEKENEKLRERIAALEEELRKTDNLKEENERLRKMLELQTGDREYKTVNADIIAFSMDNLSKTYTVNKGMKHGITKNCAVMTPYGLVGYVSEVGRGWAKICPVIDTGVSVSATVPRIANTAIVGGDMNLIKEGLCKMTYVSKDAGIEIGDYIETSGAGGIIPAGIYIGKVTEVRNDVTGVSQEAIIKPGVDFSNLKEVMIIVE